MVWQITISCIFTILNELSTKIKKIIECDYELCNTAGSENQNSYNAMKNFITMLDHLSYLVKIKLQTSPTMERERAFNLASVLVNKKKAQVVAESLVNVIKSERMKHEHLMNDIKAQITMEKFHLEQIKINQEQKIMEIINKSNYTMKKINKEMMEKERNLKIEIDSNNSEFKNIHGVNLKNEKELYAKRKEAEDKYLEILGIYDGNVGSLYRTMESLIEKSNLLDKNLKICQEKLIIQKAEYEMLKDEKELEIQQIFKKNLNKFQQNRAAKIIQTAWRRYLERLLLRKKKKSKKKK